MLGFVVLLLLERRFTLQWGKMLALYLIWYGTGRSYLESIRIDPSSDSFLGIPANVWASFVAVILGVVLLVVQSRRHPGAEPSPFTRPDSRARRKDGVAPADDAAEPVSHS
jgi:prolipoprotein diacylglyceryltransferase